jgi:hypothetical protein
VRLYTAQRGSYRTIWEMLCIMSMRACETLHGSVGLVQNHSGNAVFDVVSGQADAFQTFINGPDGPGEGVFINTVYKAMPGAMTPASKFADLVAPAPGPSPPSGGFFWVFHGARLRDRPQQCSDETHIHCKISSS